MEKYENRRVIVDWPLNRAKQDLTVYSLVGEYDDFSETQNKILKCLGMNESQSEKFTDKKKMLFKMSELLKSGDSILILSEPEQYLSLKDTLMRALALPIGVDEELSARLHKSGKDKSHADMPRGARVFMTHDGVNSGFAVRAGKQTIILLPLDAERADDILSGGARSYLAAFGNDTPSKPDNAFGESDVSVVARSLQRVGKKVAVAGTPTSVFVKNAVMNGEEPNACDNFIFTEKSQPRGEYPARDYAVLLAGKAMEESSSALGAAITNVFAKSQEDMSEVFICIAVTTNEKAVGRTLYSLPGEKPEDFLKEAAKELLRLIADVTSSMPTVVSPGMSAPEYTEPAETEPPKKKSNLWSIVVIIIALILAVVLGLKLAGFFEVDDKNADVPTAGTTVERQTLLPEFETTEPTTADESQTDESLTGEFATGESSTGETTDSNLNLPEMTMADNEVVE